MRLSTIGSAGVLAAGAFIGPVGCAAPSAVGDAPEPRLAVVRQAAGVHAHLLVHGGYWYQTRGDRLLVLDPTDGAVLREVRLGAPGRIGQATDLLLHEGVLHVVLQDDGVARLDVGEASEPVLLEVIDDRELGIKPRWLSLAGGAVYVSGEGGAVRLADRERVFTNLGDVRSVVAVADDLVATVGRRAYRISDDTFIGSASTLHPLPDTFGRTHRLVFSRRGDGDTTFGMMTPDIREVSVETATVRLEGDLRAVRFIDEMVWTVTDIGLRAWRIDDDRITLVHAYDHPGLRDVGKAAENTLALCGDFGRGIYRIADDGRNPGRVMMREQPAPGHIRRATDNGRVIAAFDGRRFWTYDTATNEVRRADALEFDPANAVRRVVTLDAQAEIMDEGRLVRIVTPARDLEHVEPGGARVHCIVAVDRTIWIGHDRGVTVLDPRRSERVVVGRLRLPGPVIHLMPRLSGGGAAWASETGGFGVIEFVP